MDGMGKSKFQLKILPAGGDRLKLIFPTQVTPSAKGVGRATSKHSETPSAQFMY